MFNRISRGNWRKRGDETKRKKSERERQNDYRNEEAGTFLKKIRIIKDRMRTWT